MLAKRTSLFNPWHRWSKCTLSRVWPIYDMDLNFFMSSIEFYWHGYRPKRILIDEKEFNFLNFNFKNVKVIFLGGCFCSILFFYQYSSVSLHSKVWFIGSIIFFSELLTRRIEWDTSFWNILRQNSCFGCRSTLRTSYVSFISRLVGARIYKCLLWILRPFRPCD